MPRIDRRATTSTPKTASQNVDGAGTPAALEPRVAAMPAVTSITLSSESRVSAHDRRANSAVSHLPVLLQVLLHRHVPVQDGRGSPRRAGAGRRRRRTA